jgi:FMN phosphatase YigB (HAD superfamily)
MSIHTALQTLNAQKYAAILLDMDNTLYDEMEYLLPVWEQIIRRFIQSENEMAEVLSYVIQDFRSKGRKGLLNRLALRLQLADDTIVRSGLEVYRSIRLKNPLSLYPEWQALPIIFPESQFFIISNGNPQQQENKWQQMHTGALKFTETVWANQWKPKPAPDALLYVMEKYHLPQSSVLFSGDDITDKEAAQASGIDFMYAKDFRHFLATCAKP